MTNFDILDEEVNSGLRGRNSGVPMGFPRLSSHIGIRKRIYFLVGGLIGSGKTGFIDDSFVLNPYDWYISDANKTDIKLTIIYRSMERSRVYKLAKWMTRRIFLDQGVLIPLNKLLGWNKGEKLTKDEHDLYLSYKDYINNLENVITIIDGPENPVGIAKDLRVHALKHGRIEELDQFNKVYVPDNENEITIVVLDHLGLLKLTKELNSKKAVIDKMSDELRYARDFFGYTPVAVQQFNREISNPIRLRNGDVEPNLDDFKESAVPQEDADVVMGLFDPVRYKVKDLSKYELDKLTGNDGTNYFRSLRLIKNTFGLDNLRIGLGFMGAIGRFKELPKQSVITDDIYQSVVDTTFFLER